MKSIIRDISIAVIIMILASAIVKPTIVKETSMLPTLQENDYLLVNKVAYKINDEKRGDIIIFKSSSGSADGKERLLVKRIIGMPGETITIQNGDVYINDDMYSEDYLYEGTTSGEDAEYKVPDNHFFVMGDNRNVSIDSRSESVGYVSEDDIVGKVWIRLFPFNKIKAF